MKSIGPHLTVVLFVWLVFGELQAQVRGRNPGHLGFEQFTMLDGFPTMSAEKIIQDDQGFLWIGSFEGLVRYDGYEFRLFEPEIDQKKNRIRNLCLDEDGNVICSSRNTLYRFNIRSETFSQLEIKGHEEKWSPKINDIITDSLNNIWIATTSGLRVIEPEHNSINQLYLLRDIRVEGRVQEFLSKWVAFPPEKKFGKGDADSKALISTPLKLSQKIKCVIVSFGEFSLSKGWLDKGWITDDKGTVIWQPNISSTYGVGGFYYDRVSIDTLSLAPGNYNLNFSASDSRAFNEIVSETNRNFTFWGIQLMLLDTSSSTTKLFADVHKLIANRTSGRWMSHSNVFTLYLDNQQDMYVGTVAGLDVFSNQSAKHRIDSFPYSYISHYKFEGLQPDRLAACQVLTISEAQQSDRLWITGYNPYLPSGEALTLESFDKDNYRFSSIKSGIPLTRKVSYMGWPHYINDVQASNNGGLWLSGSHNGLYFLPSAQVNTTGSNIVEIDQFEYNFDERTTGPIVLDLLKDKNENIWVTTDAHCIYKLKSRQRLINFFELPRLNQKSPFPFLVFADSKKRVWVSTKDLKQLFYFQRESREIVEIDTRNGEESSILGGYLTDNDGEVWFAATKGHVACFDEGSKQIKFYKITNNFVTSPRYVDEEGNIWISDVIGNVFLFDKQTKRSNKVNPFAPEQMVSGEISFITSDEHDNIWIGYTSGTLAEVESCDEGESADKGITEYSLNSIIICYEWSQEGDLWLGSRDGLLLFSKKRGVIKKYQKEDGLLDEYITGIFSDKKDRLWLHTGKGIQLFDPINEIFSRIDPMAEIPVDFGVGETSLAPDGTLFVAADKFIYFFPLDSLELDSTPSSMVLTGLQVNDNTTNLMMRHTGKIAIPYRETVKFLHTQNTIAISYAGIHYDNPKEHLYAHRLVGLNDSWQQVGKERIARYNKLSPGKYTFEVKASNADGVWTDQPATLHITILPPWYWNTLSKILYGLLGIGIILFGYQFQLNRRLAEAEALRLSELDQVKTRLYTNITHEFRTPLTVISGMTDQVLEDPKRWFREGLDMIKRNSRQLLQLVNQLLDLAKLESGSMKVQAIQDDMVPFIRYLGESFQSAAKVKEQQLYLIPTNKSIQMDFDPDKIQSIITNLLSNAIKFTPADGTIYLMIDQLETKGDKFCQIKVGDSGPGISAEQLPHIFDRFYQVDGSSTRAGEGTGIGLSLTKELVELLGGTIQVESVEGEGTTFIIELPISNNAPERTITADLDTVFSAQTPLLSHLQFSADSNEIGEKQHILLVEDNADVLQYLSSCLSDQYHLEFALNGQQGIDKAMEKIPDIIISDVMMPEKDGFELLQTLKQDERTNHIPIILLTAKADIDSKLQGLSHGADAYLAKPFHPGELEIRIQNLIEIRKNLQLRYQKSKTNDIDSTTTHQPIMKEDAFLVKVRRSVERHMADEQFGITELCQSLAISRTQLHRKLKAVTGQSTSYVVRSIRLKRAKKLLETTDLNVSEVGYAVGYTNSSHFTQDFRKEFGQPPREYKKS